MSMMEAATIFRKYYLPNRVHNYYLPCFATITLETASGTLVPAAKKVIPITESGIRSVSPKNKTKLLLFKPGSACNFMIRSLFSYELLYSLSGFSTSHSSHHV